METSRKSEKYKSRKIDRDENIMERKNLRCGNVS
jgi:hypothetical protein